MSSSGNLLLGSHDALLGTITNATLVSSTAVRGSIQSEQISLPPGSLLTAIPCTDPLQCSLSRSGIATITATNDNVLVAAAGVSDTSVILATLHCDNGVPIDATATAVSAVVTGAGSFRIYANAAATADTKVSWLIAKL